MKRRLSQIPGQMSIFQAFKPKDDLSCEKENSSEVLSSTEAGDSNPHKHVRPNTSPDEISASKEVFSKEVSSFTVEYSLSISNSPEGASSNFEPTCSPSDDA